jgi:hypothetical protein
MPSELHEMFRQAHAGAAFVPKIRDAVPVLDLIFNPLIDHDGERRLEVIIFASGHLHQSRRVTGLHVLDLGGFHLLFALHLAAPHRHFGGSPILLGSQSVARDL